MNKQIKIQTNPKSQNQFSIIDALAGVFIALFYTPIIQQITLPFKGAMEVLNIYLIQNKGKGPPGG
jgi:hypothetical protein